MHRVDGLLGECQTWDIGTETPLSVRRLRRVFEQESRMPQKRGARGVAWGPTSLHEC